MSQWDFLDFVTDQARRCSIFHLKMQAEVTDLIKENDAVAGVQAKTPHGPLEIRAGLTIALTAATPWFASGQVSM